MKKRLTKSSTNVVISGSLAGIAEYLGIDATIVRVIYVLLTLGSFGFPGFLLYIVLMVVMPSANSRRNSSSDPYDSPRERGTNRRGKPRKEVEKLDAEDDDWSDF